MLKSYYEILQIDETASKGEIKKQFRKLVRMYHPDINSTIEAEEIFKSINKAAEVLLDDEKRKKYDGLRKNNSIFKNKNYRYQNSYSFSDIFKKEKVEAEIKKPIDGEDIKVEIKIDYKEAILGTIRTVNITQATICPKCGGRKFANNYKCNYCNGLGEKILNRKITIKIPANVKNKAKLRLKGEGQTGKFGGKNGNLYAIINIENNTDFKIEDGVVYSQARISPQQAILGGNVSVLTLWGEAIIKIPPLTKANQSFKLIDVGILNEKTNKKGEQIVQIVIDIPENISKEEILLYEKIKEISLNKNAKFS